ncbi:hypothetical protein Barb7_02929 [Bacteroidales bacterium Barb7]|nr:hypothetical protein Barb7_02929 [Bacteroidales bacterium Barb7]
MKYPYWLVWENPQSDTELWVDGKLVTSSSSVTTFTLKNTRTGISESYSFKSDIFSYNDLGEAKAYNQ